MTVAAAQARSAAGVSTGALIHQMRRVLAPAGAPAGLSIYLRTAGRIFPVIEDGCSVDDGRLVEMIAPPNGAGMLCFELEGGDQIFVRDETLGGATIPMVNALVRSSLQALEAARREELLLEELGANWESLEALYEISTDALRSGDIKDALQRLIERLTGLQDGLHSALFIRRLDEFHPIVSTEEHVDSLHPEELGVAERSMREMRVLLSNGLQDTPPARACWHKATAVAAAPFSWKGSIGFVIVWSEEEGREFDSPFARVLEAITYQASVMLEGDRLNRKVRESELLAQEVEIASSIQQTLLLANAPRKVPSLLIAACSVPSQQIDGDFHDFFQHPDGTVDVVIGDVMGKGVAAALLGAATKSQILRAIANLALRERNYPPTPAQIVTRAGTRLAERLISLDRFVTLSYARFDAATQTVAVVDCGHTSMIIESKSNPECRFFRGSDLPLGVLPAHQCMQHSIRFYPGETYLFYSDGVTENRSPDGEMFGVDRLAECVQNWSSLGPTLLVEQIRKEGERFSDLEKFGDDFTCIAVRIKTDPQEQKAQRSAVFPCDAHASGSFRSWLRECADLAAGCLLEEDLSRLELACSEVFTNCALHARDFSSGSPVSARARVFRDQVAIEISHQGPEFNPLSVPPPAFDGSRESGFGIYIVLRSADDAKFERNDDDTNITTLRFLRSRTEGQ